MRRQRWAALLITTVAMLALSLQTFAQDSVAPRLLPSPSELRTGIAARNLAFQTGEEASKPMALPHRHWSKTGKILTIVGAGLLGAGTVALVHGENTQLACSNGSCVDIAWRDTGAIWAGTGAVLVIVGVTRHTTD
ncbi:MAG: hypothetical protein ACLPHP_19805 [Candidatus Sulfotelmatobacter sp.]